MKNKRGFTLIELLAVIIILAILSLIVTPIVGNVIESAKISADQRSAESYVKAAENYFAASIVDTSKKEKIGTNIIDELELSKETATGSVIVNENGEVELDIVINGHCYRKSYTQSIKEMEVDLNCSGEPSGGTGGGGSTPTKPPVEELAFLETRTPNEGTYAKSSILSITNDQDQDVDIYVKATSQASIESGSIEASCNDDLSECEGVGGTTLTANTWYKVSGNLVQIKVEANATIYTKVTNGVETKEQNTYIENIDGTIPTTPAITGGGDEWITDWNEANMTVSTLSTAPSGIAKYQYYITGTVDPGAIGDRDWQYQLNTWVDIVKSGQVLPTSMSSLPNGVYTLKVRAVSNSGMVSLESNALSYKVESFITSAYYNLGERQDGCAWSDQASITSLPWAASGIEGIYYYWTDLDMIYWWGEDDEYPFQSKRANWTRVNQVGDSYADIDVSRRSSWDGRSSVLIFTVSNNGLVAYSDVSGYERDEYCG